MRILAIRGRNLASLAGEHVQDTELMMAAAKAKAQA